MSKIVMGGTERAQIFRRVVATLTNQDDMMRFEPTAFRAAAAALVDMRTLCSVT